MEPEEVLKVSPHIFFSRSDDQAVIAANLVTGEVLQLTNKELEMLENGTRDLDGAFEKSGFLIADDEAVRNHVVERHREACRFPAVFNLTLLPTLSCNFDCRYCFEKGAPRKRMSDNVGTRVLRLVDRQARRHLRTDLSWFGGEPLLEKERISDLHPKIRDIALSSGGEFSSSITTNGYLLDEETALLLRNLDIRFVQITLDGDREVHNRNRMTKSGEGTFDRIFENMLVFLGVFKKGQITIRVNAEYDTANSILDVLDHIPHEFRNRVSIHMHHIMNVKCPTSFSDDFSENIKEVYREIRQLGFDAAVDHYLDPKPAVYCYAERATSVVVDPTGYVFRCAYTDFSEKERVGLLDQDGVVHPVGDFASDWESLVSLEPSECLGCTYLPICGFGCPRLRTTGATDFRCKNRFRFLPDTLIAMVDKQHERREP